MSLQVDFLARLCASVRDDGPLDFDEMVAKRQIVLDDAKSNVVSLTLHVGSAGCLDQSCLASVATELPALRELIFHDHCLDNDVSTLFNPGALPTTLTTLQLDATSYEPQSRFRGTISSFAGLPRGLKTLSLLRNLFSAPAGALVPLSSLPPQLSGLYIAPGNPGLRDALLGDLVAENSWCAALDDECLANADIGPCQFTVRLGDAADAPSVDGRRFVMLVRDIKAGKLAVADAERMMKWTAGAVRAAPPSAAAPAAASASTTEHLALALASMSAVVEDLRRQLAAEKQRSDGYLATINQLRTRLGLPPVAQ